MNNIINYNSYINKYVHSYQGGGKMCKILKKVKDKTPIELLTEYEIPLKPPIDVALLLERIGISSITKDFSDIEDIMKVDRGTVLGAAFSNGDNLAIFYRKADTYNRKKFTIAHELGHCCLHSKNLEIAHIELRTTSNATDAHEIEANVFAGELLIPEQLLIKTYNEFIIPSLKALSNIFGVSANVMAARLDYLGLEYFKDTVITEE